MTIQEAVKIYNKRYSAFTKGYTVGDKSFWKDAYGVDICAGPTRDVIRFILQP